MPTMKDATETPRLARNAMGAAVIAVLGLASVIVPAISEPHWMPSPLFPLLRTAIERFSWVPIASLAALGFVAGYFTRLPRLVIAGASVAILPLATIAEIAVDPSSHNLFPFEFVMYGLMALPVLGAAWIGRKIRASKSESPSIER